jgi:hypothetical protein
MTETMQRGAPIPMRRGSEPERSPREVAEDIEGELRSALRKEPPIRATPSSDRKEQPEHLPTRSGAEPEYYDTPAIGATAAAGLDQMARDFASQAQTMLNRMRTEVEGMKSKLDQEARDIEGETRELMRKMQEISESTQQRVIAFAQQTAAARKMLKGASAELSRIGQQRLPQ